MEETVARIAHRALAWCAVTILLGVARVRPAAAQRATGTIIGVVRDAQTGSVLGQATVLVPGTLLRTTTNTRGEYALARVPAGQRAVRAVYFGYESMTSPPVALGAGDTARVELALRRIAVQLPGLTVTASQLEQRVIDVPASQAVVTRRDLVERDAVTVDQALPFVPGVTINHGDLDIRGATGLAGGVGSRALFLLDGHPVLSADGGEIDFTAVPLLDIDRIEVVKGAYSALYGSNALGGVVNVITTPIGPERETIIDTHYGVYDVPSAYRFTDRRLDFSGIDVQHSRRIGNVGARFYVGRETSDGFRQDDASSRWLLRTKLSFPAGSDHPSTAYIVWSDEDAGNFFTWLSPDQPYEVPPESINDHDRSTKLSAGATIIPIARASLLVQLKPYLERDATQNHFHDNHDFHNATKLGTIAQLTSHPWSNQTITVGGEVARTDVTSNFLGRPVLEDAGLYAQDAFTASSRVSIVAGARLDSHHATGSPREVTLNPKLGLVFKPADFLSTRISFARGYRGPSAIEQFVSSVQSGFHVVPNPDLRGETAWSREVGATATIGTRFWLDGALFQSDYHGLIGPASAPGQPFVFQFRNVQRARVRGADLSARASLVRTVADAQLTYLYLDAKDVDTKLPLPYRSRHNVTATLDLFRGMVGLDLQYRSRVERVLAFPLDPRGDIAVADLRLAGRIFDTRVQLKVSNLTQAHYVDIMERTPGPPRSVLLKAMRTF
ncbi:MAG TPA: TonB-dependent receptor [Gemmatimonadaceae bacterium]